MLIMQQNQHLGRETISAKNERSWQCHINHILIIRKIDELHQGRTAGPSLSDTKKILKIFAHVKMTGPPQISNPIKGIAQSIAVTSDTEIKEAHAKDAYLEVDKYIEIGQICTCSHSREWVLFSR